MTRKPRTNLIDRSDFYVNSGRLQHFACFSCRKAFKRGFSREGEEALCPQCRQAMTNMGTDFKAPAYKELKQWRKVEALALAGIRFFPQYPYGTPGERPATLADVPHFLRRVFPPSEGLALLERGRALKPLAYSEGRAIATGRAPVLTHTLLGRPIEEQDLEVWHNGEWRQARKFGAQGNLLGVTGGWILPLDETLRLRWPQD